MANYRVISSDNHVFEPPDLWTSRAKPVFKDRSHSLCASMMVIGGLQRPPGDRAGRRNTDRYAV